MIDIEYRVVLPILINIIFSIINGLRHRHLLNRSGMVISRYQHEVTDREELITELVIVIIGILLALHFDPIFIQVIVLTCLWGIVAKIKIGQAITLTEGGIFVKGKFNKWSKVTKVKQVDDHIIDVILKRKSYEIVNVQDPEELLNLSKHYYSQN